MENDAVAYILRFLLGDAATDVVCAQVGYTADTGGYARYRVAIVPSSFFREGVYGTRDSLPALPLPEVEGAPLLYGEPRTEWVGDTLVVYADIVASAYFLVSRYEEVVRREVRDEHGRFPGRESLPFRAGFIDRPVVDEYGRLLRKWLRQMGVDVPEPERRIKKVYLTHDIDVPFYCRSLRSLAGRIARGESPFRVLGYYLGRAENDPNFTYPHMIAADNALRTALGSDRCEAVYFFKPDGKHRYDKPHYKIGSRGLRKAFRLLSGQATIGLHAGYDSGIHPERIAAEKQKLERVIGQSVRYNRHHFLASRQPEDMAALEQAGITDDFTLGYADVAGFRLGTSRPVRWVDPVAQRVSGLTLHPLMVMEHTLDNERYMNLSYDEALAYCLRLIDRAAQVGGELVLLWHNEAFNAAGCTHYAKWQPRLYQAVLDELRNNVQ